MIMCVCERYALSICKFFFFEWQQFLGIRQSFLKKVINRKRHRQRYGPLVGNDKQFKCFKPWYKDDIELPRLLECWLVSVELGNDRFKMA